MLVVETPMDMVRYVGQKVGVSDWVTIDQTMIDDFARVTGDHSWIHVDVARAARERPGGKTIAHGFLTLSLIPQLQFSLLKVERYAHALNYGCNRVRFPGPTPVGSRVRLHQTVKDVVPIEGAVRITFECSVEVEGLEKPGVFAETVVQMYPV